jgi:hypothetical protein
MSIMVPSPVQSPPILPTLSFPTDQPLLDLLQKPPDSPAPAGAEHESRPSLALPSPV